VSGFATFYPIVDSADWIRRLVSSGITLVQLRIKHQPADVIAREVRAALRICNEHDAQLVVNDHWEAALTEGADYVHLGQSDLDDADLPAIRARGLRLGVSTHDDAELERALSIDADYVALGPIFPTSAKVMPWAPQGLERIGEWKRRIGHRPLVAIGGITLERASACREAGADCLAVISDLVGHPDPAARARAWIDAMRRSA
jgi:thiamine-phosphate pyrophosphorylase